MVNQKGNFAGVHSIPLIVTFKVFMTFSKNDKVYNIHKREALKTEGRTKKTLK